MRKICIISFAIIALVMTACGNQAVNKTPGPDTTGARGPDSAANNSIIPPSEAPGNAGNSSLADTTYPKKDSIKK
jgi:hypothetical protein